MAVVNTLFTSAGRRVELLRSFRRVYATLGVSGVIVATDIDPLAPAFSEADRTYIVPPVTDGGYVVALASICKREGIGLVFPLIDPDIPVLAAHRAELEEHGARVMVVSKEAADATGDKWLTADLFTRLGIPSPRCWLPDDARSADLAFPVFLKPRFGSAGKGTFVARDRRELDFFLDYVDNPLVQELLTGPEVTSDVVCDQDGTVLSVVSRQRIEVRSGEVSKGKTVRNQEIAEHCVRVAGALEARGPITVQCFMESTGPSFTEVNCRFGGGAPLGIAAGADSPLWLVAQAAGLPIEVPPIGSYQEGLYISRFDDSIFLDEAERARIARSNI